MFHLCLEFVMFLLFCFVFFLNYLLRSCWFRVCSLLSSGLLRWMRSMLTGFSWLLLCLSVISEISRAFPLFSIVSNISKHKQELHSRPFQNARQQPNCILVCRLLSACNNKYELQR